jgi:hypothetical protein
MMRDSKMRICRDPGQTLARTIMRGVVLALLTIGATSAEEKRPLPGMTYASLQALPRWGGWWNRNEAPPAEFARQPPPMRPEDVARIRAARAQDLDPDAGRWCRPYEFVGYSGGFVDSVEFLFTPGRVTLTNESGLIRRIYTDGRPVPRDVEATNTGVSVGHWDGETLVVETVGINPDAKYPGPTPGARPIGKNVRITERIALKGDNTLEFDVTVVAPDVLTAPDRRKRLYSRASKQAAREVSFCVDRDRSIDAATGKQRFDMTPPKDLPPPPPPPK